MSAITFPIKAISEFANVITGGTPSTRNKSYWDGDIPWLNSGALNHGEVTTPSKFITQEGLENSAAKLKKGSQTNIEINLVFVFKNQIPWEIRS